MGFIINIILQRFFKEEVKCYGVKTGTVGKIANKYWKEIKSRDKEEIFNQDIEGDMEDPGELLKSYEKLLTFLGYKPDLDRMYCGDGLLILQFDESGYKK